MFAVIIVVIIVWIVMWGFYKFMYPRPPKSMMPQKGDVTTPRACNFCGNRLAEYRGVLEPQSTSANSDNSATLTNTATSGVEVSAVKTNGDNATDINATEQTDNALFFCNYEHQADFHAGKNYLS